MSLVGAQYIKQMKEDLLSSGMSPHFYYTLLCFPGLNTLLF